jgi:hypothetical protein
MEYTNEEARNLFLDCIESCIQYWEKVEIDEDTKKYLLKNNISELRWKMEGVAFSILVIIDGGAGNFPGSCLLIPFCSDEDKKEFKKMGEKYFPISDKLVDMVEKYDIGGGLHELLGKKRYK